MSVFLFVFSYKKPHYKLSPVYQIISHQNKAAYCFRLDNFRPLSFYFLQGSIILVSKHKYLMAFELLESLKIDVILAK